MAARNLISIKQLRQDELSGYALAVTSGYIRSYVSGITGQIVGYVQDVSGDLSDGLNTASGELQDQITDLQAQINSLSTGGGGTFDSGALVSLITGISGSLQTRITGISGYLQSQINSLNAISGSGVRELTSVTVSLSSGVDTIHCLYGETLSNSVAVGALGSSGAADPIIISMLTSKNATGQVVELTSPTPSPNYYVNLLVRV